MYFWKYILAKKAGLSQKKCNMALYGLPVLPIAEAFEKTVTGNPISVSDALAQDALSLQVAFEPTQDGTPSIDSEPTTEPYLSKVIPRGNKEYYSLVGGTVAWNQLVQNGASDVNESGVMNIPWADGNNNYVMPMNLCHIETVEDTENNSIQVADFESHYVLPFDCVFDAAEAIIAGDTDLAAGDYYFKIVNDSWGNNNGKYVLFTLDADLVAGQQIRKKSGAFNAAIEDCTLGIFTSGSDRTGTALAFTVQTTQPESGTNLGQTDGTGWCNFWHCVVLGYNRWKYSAVRQFLNSDATAGNWWTQQHKWDVMPAYATTKNGFLYGITAGIKEHLKETKVYTARNTVFNGGDTPLGGMDETLDKVFLAALEQSWIEPQESGEGTYWEYYKSLLGTNTPVARSQTYPLLIKYDLAAKTTARSRWLRSCHRGGATTEWYVYSSGGVTNNYATGGIRVAPCLRIATSDLEYFKGTLNHKYMIKNGTSHFISIADSNSYVNMIKGGNSDMSIDLTLMFANAPAIADYAYFLEQSEAGSGIAWLKSYGFFTKDYYPYSAGELISVKTSGHKTVGFNQWDERCEVGSLNTSTGAETSSNDRLRTKNYISILPNTAYYTNVVFANRLTICYYDVNKDFISSAVAYNIDTFMTPTNARYMRFYIYPDYGKIYHNDICINLSDPEKNGTYKPYVTNTYPIDPTDLRGLFKLSNGKLYCEGDTRSPSGSVERNFEYRAYQSGDESLTDAITDGTHTVVKLATPTTETATPYTSPIDVEVGGTEEFIDNRTVPIPVGNETYYASEYAVHGKTGVTVSHGATEDDPNPTEYEVEFTSQGTVYGGTVDIVSGVLSVTWAILSNPQNLYWTTNSSQGMKNFQTDRGTVSKKSGSNNWKCSRYSNGFIGTDKTEGIFIFDSGEVCIRDYRYWEHGGTSEERAAFKASLADVTIAYELATPQTYNLTPEQVTMLLGDNYLVTEDGTITITYMAGK